MTVGDALYLVALGVAIWWIWLVHGEVRELHKFIYEQNKLAMDFFAQVGKARRKARLWKLLAKKLRRPGDLP